MAGYQQDVQLVEQLLIGHGLAGVFVAGVEQHLQQVVGGRRAGRGSGLGRAVPGNGRPHQLAEGMRWVLVNGVPVIAEGKATGARPGKVLRGPGATSP